MTTIDPFCPPIRSGICTQLEGYETHGDVIGKGSSAFVFAGTCLATGEPVAIKEIDFDRIGCSERMRQQFESEIIIMQQLAELKHENILALRKAFTAQCSHGRCYQYLILDFCNGEDLKAYLKTKRNRLEEEEAKLLMLQFGSLLSCGASCLLYN